VTWWKSAAPVEPSAAERVHVGLDPSACAACHCPELPSVTIVLPGYGDTRVCAMPAPCRERAQPFGIYGRAS